MSRTTLLGNRYQLEAEIGAGGMARVFRAADTVLGRPVAIKMLRDQFADDPEFVHRFQQEARSAGSLNHPNIVTVFDVGEDRGREYLVMQYVDGPNLKELIRSRGRFAIADAVQIVRGICAALEFAHRHGIVHRDVKPQNVLIGSDGAIKLTDFGIARALGAGSFSKTGEVLGTVQYLAPEQVQGHPATAVSDIYAAGIVLYELLTGHAPYGGDSPIAIAMQHVQGPLPRLRAVDSRAPAQLDAVLARALAKDPRGRYASAAEFGQALARFAGGDVTQRLAAGRAAPAPPAVRQSRRGLNLPFVLLGAFTSLVVLGLCLIGALIAWQ